METTHQRALSKFGETNQHIKMIEECSELIKAISDKLQGNEHNISEEIADVQIVLNQLKVAYPEWITWEQIKLKRLEEKMGESR